MEFWIYHALCSSMDLSVDLSREFAKLSGKEVPLSIKENHV